MNVTSLITVAYENKSDWTLGENKPNSKPISERPKMNANLFVTKDYNNEQRTMNDHAKQTQSNPISLLPKPPILTTLPPKNNLRKSHFPLNQDIFSLVYDMRYAIA